MHYTELIAVVAFGLMCITIAMLSKIDRPTDEQWLFMTVIGGPFVWVAATVVLTLVFFKAFYVGAKQTFGGKR